MKRIVIISAIIILTTVAAFLIMPQSKGEKKEHIKKEVERGEFVIDITTTGELEAKNSKRILGPMGLRSMQISQIKITEMIPEGTVVDSGDYVASLDPTEINDKIKDLETELEKLRSQYTKTQLDTALTLKQARESIRNLEYAAEEKAIELEESKFEPPAVIRRTEIELEKAERALTQAEENYVLKEKQSQANMREVSASLGQAQRRHKMMKDFLSELTVTAPAPGMVIYMSNWDGEKVKAGSIINSWSNTVALLPDLSIMVSKTFVNEVDISRVQVGQKVKIGIDAFPDVEYNGTVDEVANIGQELYGSDAKVFEVVILVDDADSVVKPAMTTKNSIVIEEFDDVVHIPLEAVHSIDSLTYVFVENGFNPEAKEVKLGSSGTDEVIVEEGLDEGEIIYISEPDIKGDIKGEIKRLDQ